MSLAPIVKKLKQAIKDKDLATIEKCEALIESYEDLIGAEEKVPTKKRGRPKKVAVAKKKVEPKRVRRPKTSPDLQFENPKASNGYLGYKNGSVDKVERPNQFYDDLTHETNFLLPKKKKKPPRKRATQYKPLAKQDVQCSNCGKMVKVSTKYVPRSVDGETAPNYRCDKCCAKG